MHSLSRENFNYLVRNLGFLGQEFKKLISGASLQAQWIKMISFNADMKKGFNH